MTTSTTTIDQSQKPLVGFARMTKERLTEISRKAGKKAHELGRAHTFTSEEASRAGKKGGGGYRGRGRRTT